MNQFFDALLNKLFKKKESQKEYIRDPIDESIDSYSQTAPLKTESLLRPSLPGVQSIRKKRVYLLAIVLILVTLMSFAYNNKKESSTPKQDLSSSTATVDPKDKELSYSDFLNGSGKNLQNPNGNVNPNMQNGQNQNRQNMQNQNGYPQNNTNQAYVPNVEGPRNNGMVAYPNGMNGNYGYVPYVGNPNMQNMGQQNQPASNNVNTPKDNYVRSPIGFSLGNSSASGQTTNSNGFGAASASAYYGVSANTVTAGTLIPVTLSTGIDSDMPSQVVCQVRESVYDSITGENLLIPQGTKIIGEVNTGSVGVAQERIAVNWKRMILPNGYSVNIGSMPGVDTEGYPGLKDRVNQHEGKIINATLLTSLLSAGVQIAAGNTSSGDSMSYGQLATAGAATNVMTAGSKLLERNINVNPTIQISPGTPFNIFVNQDLVLRPYE